MSDVLQKAAISSQGEQSVLSGALQRFVLIAVMTIGTGHWIGVWAAAAFAVAALAYEALFLCVLAPHFLLKHMATDPERSMRNGLAVTAAASLIYLSGWAPVFLTGAEGVGYFAALVIAGLVVHNLLYIGEPRLFALAMAPHVVAAVGAPFFTQSPVVALILGLAAAGLFASAFLALRERIGMMEKMLEHESGRQRAEAANVAKSDFLATMSHELRTPLNAVIGYAEILEEDMEERGDASSAADANRIHRSARDLLRLINEVLDFSKIEAGRMEISVSPTDAAEVLRGVVETTEHIARANDTEITLEIDAAVSTLELDGARLRQCALNLVSNACKFTHGGAVHIKAELQRDTHGGMLVITVADTGVGIAQEDLQRLFQPFVQADSSKTRKHEGTGLGLAITRRLAQLMGGDVSALSECGVGSTFTLSIRVGLLEERGEGPLVLVIDDSADARDLIRRVAAKLPVRVKGVSTAAEGLATAASESPALVILDLNLPDASGWHVLEELKSREETAITPVVVCTVEDARARAAGCGASNFLPKPVDREELTKLIERWTQPAKPKLLREAA